jgi:hypothetical protein
MPVADGSCDKLFLPIRCPGKYPILQSVINNQKSEV